MPGSRVTRGAVATVVGVLALAVFLSRPDHPKTVAAAPSAPAVTPSPVGTPFPAPSPVAARPARPRPVVRHDRVPAARPTAFRISGPAFTTSASVCAMPNVRPLDPPGDQVHTVCWVREGFGVAPGTDSRGTSYILGHAWSRARLVLNPLSEFATAHAQPRAVLEGGVATYPVPALRGYGIRLTTPHGVLGYRVTRAYLVGKLAAADVPSLMADRTPDRVVLITCAVRDGVDLDQNVVVYASLVSSTAA